MKIIISPAKRFNQITKYETEDLLFKRESEILVEEIRKLSLSEIANMFKLNDSLAIKVYYDYKEFDFDNLNNPAIFSYDGLVYKQFSEKDFDDLKYLNEHVRIISALYGLLKPFTGIRDYRLDMEVKFIDMYKFWSDKIYKNLYKNEDTIINLASNEYSKLISKYVNENQNFITINFKDNRNGKYRSVVAWTKEMRGKMLKYLIQNKIDDISRIKEFSEDGYKYNPYLSSKNDITFTRG